MSSGSLIGHLIRDLSRRYLSFQGTPSGVVMPRPTLDKRYLLYIHVPFCVVLCPFCSFHRVEFKRQRTQDYFRALQREIRTATDAGFRFGELYVGGGTPTVMPHELIQTIDLIREWHPLSCVSTETNPDDLSAECTSQLQAAGVNRLSVGVQSFDDTLLREMQRYEKYGSGKQIQERLKNAIGRFETLNVDMIFNFPHQSEASLATDLEILTSEVKADQVSYYPLMTTDSTQKAMHRDLGTVDYGREKAMYHRIVDHMIDAGYTRASAWCFSRRPSMIDEYISEQDEYLGLGSGAFSFLNGCIYSSTFSINHYMRLANEGKAGIVRQRQLRRIDQLRYYLLTRLFSGSLDIARAEEHFGGDFSRSLRTELAGLRISGAITRDGTTLRLTERGYYFWVVMMREFFTGVNNLRAEMRHDIGNEFRNATLDA